jgi:hypothetical protein
MIIYQKRSFDDNRQGYFPVSNNHLTLVCIRLQITLVDLVYLQL